MRYIILAVVSFALGYAFCTYRAPQSANELLRAGFTILDPSGFEVERFE